MFSSQKVREALRAHGVVLLKADWTSRDPRITEALASFNRSAVPLDLIYAPGRAEPSHPSRDPHSGDCLCRPQARSGEELTPGDMQRRGGALPLRQPPL